MSASDDAKKVAAMIPTIWKDRTLPAIYALAQRVVLEAVASAKEKAPWTDRTTSARNFLFGNAFKDVADIGFFVAHGVQYGVYLELANDRKYEVLRPTIELYGEKYLIGVRRLIGAR